MVETEERVAESAVEGTAGEIRIASDVVATIASLAASEIKGIAGMSGGIVGGIAEMLGRKNLTKGVKVELTDQETSIDVFVIVEYGCNIPDVCKLVQENVKSIVENMTGLNCRAVNIHVQGLAFPPGHPYNPIKEKKEEEK